MILRELTEIVRDYERRLAPGSETALWGLYSEDVRKQCGVLPYHDHDSDIVVSQDMVEYWLDQYEKAERGIK